MLHRERGIEDSWAKRMNQELLKERSQSTLQSERDELLRLIGHLKPSEVSL
jgi:hypothetical protein